MGDDTTAQADDLRFMWDEVADIGALLHELPDAAFDTPSLCEGWDVKAVLAHMILGHTTPMGTMLVKVAQHGFSVPKASLELSRTHFTGKSADEVRREWDDVMIAEHPRKGISKMIPTKEAFLDHLVHNQDIRRPTGTPRTIPQDHLLRALELVRGVGNPFFAPKKNVAGLRLVATDIDWSAGAGPAVEGPGEAIVMAASGRAVALADLTGDGVATLRSRITA